MDRTIDTCFIEEPFRERRQRVEVSWGSSSWFTNERHISDVASKLIYIIADPKIQFLNPVLLLVNLHVLFQQYQKKYFSLCFFNRPER